MPRDTKKVEESRRKRKKDYISDSDSDSENSSSEEEMDNHEYKKFLAKMFPSKYKNSQVKNGEKIKKMLSPTANGKTKNKKSK